MEKNEEQQERQEFERLKAKYPYIYKWGKYLGSYNYYILNEMLGAENDKAPENAISKTGGKWDTVDDIKNPRVRQALGLPKLPE